MVLQSPHIHLGVDVAQVLGLSWCPCPAMEGTNTRSHLLASSGRDRMIQIWEVGDEDSDDTAHSLKRSIKMGHQGSGGNNDSRAWCERASERASDC